MDGKEVKKEARRGYWYEVRDGKRLVCFKVRIHGQKFVQKLELPVGVRELKPAI